MNVLKFVKLPPKVDDPTQRYAVVSVVGKRGGEFEVVADVIPWMLV